MEQQRVGYTETEKKTEVLLTSKGIGSLPSPATTIASSSSCNQRIKYSLLMKTLIEQYYSKKPSESGISWTHT
jgi:hypothetical protein